MNTIRRYVTSIGRYLRNKRGVSALEYAVLTGVIAAGVGAAVATFSNEIETFITDVAAKIEAVNPEAIKLDGTSNGTSTTP